MAYRTRILSHACLCHFRVYTTVTQLQEEVSWQRQLKSAIWVCFLILFSSLPLYDSILTWMQRRKNLVLLFGLHFSTQDGCKKIKMTATKWHDFGGGWRKAGRLTKTGTKLAYQLQSAVYLWRFRRRPGLLPLYCFLFWNPFYAFSFSAIQQRFYVCVKESVFLFSVSELLMGEVDSSTLLSLLPTEKSRVSLSPIISHVPTKKKSYLMWWLCKKLLD